LITEVYNKQIGEIDLKINILGPTLPTSRKVKDQKDTVKNEQDILEPKEIENKLSEPKKEEKDLSNKESSDSNVSKEGDKK
jgi:hypothetical protein